ncbi:MAG: 3-phosphoshikimate 1-carboxyvinyltransferase [Gammaproteobacteria bacterium]|nr:MAG: 3-phosphoshikimate 1-carboxyvinyltransferase [Gammaproteobacteria bacterium]
MDIQSTDGDSFPRHMLTSKLMQKIDPTVAKSFSEQQLSALEGVLSCNSNRLHAIDFRNTIHIWNRSYYYVVLAGADHRSMTRQQKHALRNIEILFLLTLSSTITLTGLVLAYLIKSSLGIDLMPNQSLGLWDWFKFKINE